MAEVTGACNTRYEYKRSHLCTRHVVIIPWCPRIVKCDLLKNQEVFFHAVQRPGEAEGSKKAVT